MKGARVGDGTVKVLLVAAATSTTGGGERHVADLLRQLPALGIKLGLVCPPGGDLTALAESLGVPVTSAPIASGSALAGTRAVRAAIREFDPQVVHAHGSRAAFFARRADARASRRCVYTVHGIHVDRAGSWPRRVVFTAIERALKGRTARFVCVCGSDVSKGERLGLLDAERATVIYNGIPLPSIDAASDVVAAASGAFRAELGLAADTPLALSIGRFHEQKDQATLVAAWARVVKALPGAVLALIGGGELEDELKQQAHETGLADAVRFVAPRADLAPAYAGANVFALSSRWEGLPYVVLEALGYGLPVVSSAVDGIPEAVDDGVSGLLVPPGDPYALATALVDVLSDAQRARAMGAAGRARIAQDFTLAGMAHACVNVYREVASADATGKSQGGRAIT